ILFPAVAGVHDAVTGTVAVVHLDAHLDLLDHSPAQGRFSQSSGMRRALELPRVSARHSIQVGTRNFNFPSSKRFLDGIGLTELPARLVARRGLDWTLSRIREVVGGADHVFLTVDLDVLDPAHAPGVGWHEPGGLTSRDLIDLVVALAPDVRGFALNELNPMTDHRAQSSILAANLVFQFAVAAAQRPAAGDPGGGTGRGPRARPARSSRARAASRASPRTPWTISARSTSAWMAVIAAAGSRRTDTVLARSASAPAA